MPNSMLSVICILESRVERPRQELCMGNQYDSGALVFTRVRFLSPGDPSGNIWGDIQSRDYLGTLFPEHRAATEKNLTQMSVMLSLRDLAIDAEAS